VIKAIYFDWFNTLAGYYPPREELYQQAFQEHGIEISIRTVSIGLQVGDRSFFSLSTRNRVRGMTFEDRAVQFLVYPRAICQNAGLEVSEDIQLQVIRKVLREFTGEYALFQDTLPLLQALKSRNTLLGIITNADQNVYNLISKLDVRKYLDVVVTSEQAGAEKPSAVIFNAALTQGKHPAGDSLYIGDQYQSDILGARAAGMQAVLIDRYGIEPERPDCLKISSLAEALKHLG
jgi:HAD superfamily hydrolase (TIGR01549 family)